MTPLEKMFWEDLGESLHSEEMLAKAMFRMDQAVTSEPLRKVMRQYRDDAQNQALKVRALFEKGEVMTREKKAEGIMAYLTKAQQMMVRGKPGPALDAALLAVCIKVATLNVISYSTLRAWASLSTAPAAKIVVSLDALIKTAKAGLDRFEHLSAACNQAAAKAAAPEVKTRG